MEDEWKLQQRKSLGAPHCGLRFGRTAEFGSPVLRLRYFSVKFGAQTTTNGHASVRCARCDALGTAAADGKQAKCRA